MIFLCQIAHLRLTIFVFILRDGCATDCSCMLLNKVNVASLMLFIKWYKMINYTFLSHFHIQLNKVQTILLVKYSYGIRWISNILLISIYDQSHHKQIFGLFIKTELFRMFRGILEGKLMARIGTHVNLTTSYLVFPLSFHWSFQLWLIFLVYDCDYVNEGNNRKFFAAV